MVSFGAFRDRFSVLPAEELERQFVESWGRTSERFAKLEVAPVYIEQGSDSFELFAAGEFSAARASVKKTVLQQRELFEDLQARGGSIVRLRVVGVPLTSYIADYERVVYDTTSVIGEHTSIIDESSLTAEELALTQDFLCFDQRELIVHDYSPWGRLREVWWTDDPEVVALAIGVFDALLAKSVPAAEWPWPPPQL
ncbi:MAG: hypothetical protein JWO99_479 [Candidatus Saccharibacteria bacterium]|nr:hypothetical protein [Candidatus Saccharibacteria bacterium]